MLEEREFDATAQAWQPRRQFIYGGRYIDEPLIFDKDTTSNGVLDTRYYYAQQANFNVVAVAKDNGDGTATVVETITYDPYGQATVVEAQGQTASGNPYLFQGRRFDAETGLYYFRNRMYSAELGRFLQRDPLGYVDGMNLYEFVGGRPVIGVDPYGLAFWHSCDATGKWKVEQKEYNQRFSVEGTVEGWILILVGLKESPKPVRMVKVECFCQETCCNVITGKWHTRWKVYSSYSTFATYDDGLEHDRQFAANLAELMVFAIHNSQGTKPEDELLPGFAQATLEHGINQRWDRNRVTREQWDRIQQLAREGFELQCKEICEGRRSPDRRHTSLPVEERGRRSRERALELLQKQKKQNPMFFTVTPEEQERYFEHTPNE